VGDGESEGHLGVVDGTEDPYKLHRSRLRAGEPVEKDLAVFLKTCYYEGLGIVAEVLAWLLGYIGTK